MNKTFSTIDTKCVLNWKYFSIQFNNTSNSKFETFIFAVPLLNFLFFLAFSIDKTASFVYKKKTESKGITFQYTDWKFILFSTGIGAENWTFSTSLEKWPIDLKFHSNGVSDLQKMFKKFPDLINKIKIKHNFWKGWK